MKSKISFMFFAASFFPVLFSQSLHAASPTDIDRENAITRELNCISSHIQSNQALLWNDVCVTNEDAKNMIEAANSSAKKTLNVSMDKSGQVTVEKDRATGSHPEYIEEGSSDDAAIMEAPIEDAEAEEKDEEVDATLAHEDHLKAPMSYKKSSSELSSFFSHDNPLSKFEFGTDAYAFRYREPNFIKGHKGYLYGIFGSYAYRLSENKPISSIGQLFSPESNFNMIKVDGRFSYGKVDYEGSGTIDGITDYTFEFRGVLGYDISTGSTLTFTPYAGLGYRYLNDDTGGLRSSTGALGYERESRYVYIPIGLETTINMGSSWQLGMTSEFDLFIDGEQKSHLEDVSSSLEAIENDQNDGYGVRGSLRLTKKNDSIDVFVEPFVRYWHIKDSNISPITVTGGTVIGFGLEPDNNSTEYGIRLGARY